MTVNPIPDGYHTVTPYLMVEGAAAAIAFYEKAFGAIETFRMAAPDGKRLMHAEFRIGDSVVMIGDTFPEFGGGGALSAGIHLYVADVDGAFRKAVAAGATVVMPVADMFWGDRFGKLRDPFGQNWSIATHIRDVPPDEMKTAAAKAFG